MIAADKAEVIFGLLAKAVKDYFYLVCCADHVLLLFQICLFFLAGGEWEAGATLEKVPLLLEVIFEGVGVFLDILQKFVDNAAKAPYVRGLIIMLLDERNFGSTVPS